jgi:hypothetical protein
MAQERIGTQWKSIFYPPTTNLDFSCQIHIYMGPCKYKWKRNLITSPCEIVKENVQDEQGKCKCQKIQRASVNH